MPKISAYVATVHLIVAADSEAEACDTVSAFLSETGVVVRGNGILDWSYRRSPGAETRLGDGYIGPLPVELDISDRAAASFERFDNLVEHFEKDGGDLAELVEAATATARG